MNGSNPARVIAPMVTIISLAAWLIWPAYAASRAGRKASYIPRHARPGKGRIVLRADISGAAAGAER